MRLLFLVIVKILFISGSSVFAQYDKSVSPITIKGLPLKKDVGLAVMIGGNMQSGSYYSSVCQCDFLDAYGAGFSFSGFFESELFKMLRFGGELGFNSLNATGSYIEIEGVEFISAESNFSDIVPVRSRHTGDFSASYVFFRPYLKFFPFKFLYLKGGLGVSMNMSGSLKHTQETLQKTALLKNGEIGEIYRIGPGGEKIYESSEVIEDADYPEMNTLLLSADLGIGLDFQLNKHFAFSPSFEYSIPFGNISEYGENFQISYWRLRAELRYSILNDKDLYMIYD